MKTLLIAATLLICSSAQAKPDLNKICPMYGEIYAYSYKHLLANPDDVVSVWNVIYKKYKAYIPKHNINLIETDAYNQARDYRAEKDYLSDNPTDFTAGMIKTEIQSCYLSKNTNRM